MEAGRLDRVPVPHVCVLARFCQCKAPSCSLILLVTTVSFILKITRYPSRYLRLSGRTDLGCCPRGSLPDLSPIPATMVCFGKHGLENGHSNFEWFYSISGFYSISADFFTLPSRELTTREETPYTRPAGEVPPGIDSALPHTNCASTCAST